MVSHPTLRPEPARGPRPLQGRRGIQGAQRRPRQAARQPRHRRRPLPAGLDVQDRHRGRRALERRVHARHRAARPGRARPAADHGRPAQRRRRARAAPNDRTTFTARAGDLVQHARSATSASSSAPTRCVTRPRSSVSATRSRSRCGSRRAGPGRAQPAAARAVGHRPVRRARHAAADGDAHRRRRQPRRRHDSPTSCSRSSARDLGVIERAEPQRAVAGGHAARSPRQLTEMMEAVVENGSGSPAQIDGVEVAGKTGTAEHGRGSRAARLVHLVRAGQRPARSPWRSSSRTAATPTARPVEVARRRPHRQGHDGGGAEPK